jgi:transcriptional regulator with XRE-family HTH domain
MQAKNAEGPTNGENRLYHGDMPRRLSKTRPKQGAHLAALRKGAGLSQVELAESIGESQQNVAFWEQSEKPPRSDVLPRLADALGVSVEDLLRPGQVPTARRRRSGKMAELLDELAKLPRRQQQRALEVLRAVVNQYKQTE